MVPCIKNEVNVTFQCTQFSHETFSIYAGSLAYFACFLSCTDYIALSMRIILKDESDRMWHVLGTVLVFAWRDGGKPYKTSDI
jgi:hypothetical protein